MPLDSRTKGGAHGSTPTGVDWDALGSLTDGLLLVVHGRVGTILYANAAAVATFGFSPVGRPITEIADPRDRSALLDLLCADGQPESGGVSSLRMRTTGKHGRGVVLQTRWRMAFGTTGLPLHHVIMANEVLDVATEVQPNGAEVQLVDDALAAAAGALSLAEEGTRVTQPLLPVKLTVSEASSKAPAVPKPQDPPVAVPKPALGVPSLRSGSSAVLAPLLDNCVDLMFYIDAVEGTILAVNRACYGMLGFRRTEVVGRNYYDFMAMDDHAEVAAKFEALHPGESATLEFKRRHRCSKTVVVECIVTALPPPASGAPQEPLRRCLCVERDITQRWEQAAAEELRRRSRAAEARHRGARRQEEALTALALRNCDYLFKLKPCFREGCRRRGGGHHAAADSGEADWSGHSGGVGNAADFVGLGPLGGAAEDSGSGGGGSSGVCGHVLITYASPAAAAVLGVAAEDLVGMSDYGYIASADIMAVHEARAAAFERARDNGGDANLPPHTYRRIAADGRTIWVEASYFGVAEEASDDGKARLSTVLVIEKDVTKARDFTLGVKKAFSDAMKTWNVPDGDEEDGKDLGSRGSLSDLESHPGYPAAARRSASRSMAAAPPLLPSLVEPIRLHRGQSGADVLTPVSSALAGNGAMGGSGLHDTVTEGGDAPAAAVAPPAGAANASGIEVRSTGSRRRKKARRRRSAAATSIGSMGSPAGGGENGEGGAAGAGSESDVGTSARSQSTAPLVSVPAAFRRPRLPFARRRYLLHLLGLTTDDVNAPMDCVVPELRYPLVVAAAQNNAFRLALLLALGAEADLAPSDVGFGALHMAVMSNSLECLTLLGAFAANLDILAEVDDEIATPLAIACKEGYTELVMALLEMGAQVNCVDHDGNTPLHHAVELDHAPIAKALLAQGANVMAANNEGFTPSMLAEKLGASDCAQAVRTVARNISDDAAEVLLHELGANPRETTSTTL